MKLVDFLVHLLKTQANTLQRLAAYFGEEYLLELLEAAGDTIEAEPLPIHLDLQWFYSTHPDARSSVYTELEGAVNEMDLPSVFEFHLWAYPFYRAIIESPLDLTTSCVDEQNLGVENLIDEAVTQAQVWIHHLPFRPDLSQQVENLTSIPWLRFRSEVLKKIGKRPIASIKSPS